MKNCLTSGYIPILQVSELNLTFQENFSGIFTIYDINTRKIISQYIDHIQHYSIDVSGLKSGQYIIELINDDGQIHSEIISIQ